MERSTSSQLTQILISVLAFALAVNGQCNFPDELVGHSWIRGIDGNVWTFAANTVTGVGITRDGSVVLDLFTCHEKIGSEYVLMSEEYESRTGGSNRFFMCIELIKTTSSSFVMNELTGRTSRLFDKRIGILKSSYTDKNQICTLQGLGFASRYFSYLIKKDSQPSDLKVPCPSHMQKIFTHESSCAGTAIVDGCTDSGVIKGGVTSCGTDNLFHSETTSSVTCLNHMGTDSDEYFLHILNDAGDVICYSYRHEDNDVSIHGFYFVGACAVFALNPSTELVALTLTKDSDCPTECTTSNTCANFTSGQCVTSPSGSGCTCYRPDIIPCTCDNGFILSTTNDATLDKCVDTTFDCISNSRCLNFAGGRCVESDSTCSCFDSSNTPCLCTMEHTLSTANDATLDTCVAIGKSCTVDSISTDCYGEKYIGTCTNNRCDCSGGSSKEGEDCSHAGTVALSLVLLVASVTLTSCLI